MKNNKISQTPPLVQGNNTVNDPQQKITYLIPFSRQSHVSTTLMISTQFLIQCIAMDGIPKLESINTSQIKLSKIIRNSSPKNLSFSL